MGNSRCDFEKDLQRSWILPRHRQVTGKQPQPERLQTQVPTHESKVFRHSWTAGTYFGKSENVLKV